MQDRPDLRELLECVRDFLQNEAVPRTSDPHLRFRVRIAANVLSIAAREIELEEELLRKERRRLLELYPEAGVVVPAPDAVQELKRAVKGLTERLARELRSGQMAAAPGDPVWSHVRAALVEKLQVANPAWLKRTGKNQ
ncbi:MAG: hypothetical protein HY717_07380 [Planctomycetes bacterium]|nr:hypothetical protein [Planctomycetota bacterium]